jgi:PAS domain S-box-containing protein
MSVRFFRTHPTEKKDSEMSSEVIDVLLIEDEEDHAEAVRRAFEKEGGRIRVTWAAGISEALSYLKKSTPHLVVTDWLLPDGKGTDILPPDETLRRFPVVLMTSHGNEQVAVDAMKAGVVDYVMKSPATFAEMPKTAERALRQWNLIVQRKRAEEKLRESEERFRTVFEQGPLGMHIAKPDYHFVVCNDAFRQLVGYSDAELIELTFMDITHPEDHDTDIEQVQKLIRGETASYKIEKRLVNKDGNVRWTDVTRSILRSADGTPSYFLTMVEDITERKQAEMVLKQTLLDLTRSNEDLEQFAYVASHDLQEPLRNVSSCVQLLEKEYRGKLSPDADQLIRYAIESVVRMKALIQDLLTYSRISTQGKTFQSTNCEETLHYAMENLSSSITQSKAIITHDPFPVISADATQLMQVFQNLISNAIKFQKQEQARIHVSAFREDNGWVFSVKDNGMGLESQHLKRIFLIFQRLHKRSEYEGTGIGLAIARKIIERHRGRIWVESQPGIGTTFYFTIPD